MEAAQLARLEKKITPELQNKYYGTFSRQAGYLGNGIYGIPGTNLMSTDTRELFVMFVAAKENFKYKAD